MRNFMDMTIIKKPVDSRYPKAFTHKLADLPNGINLITAGLTQKVIFEGTAIGKGTDGMARIIKTAKLTAPATATDVKYLVAKGHNFQVGDVVMANANAKAYTITKIETNSTDISVDDITLNTTLGVALVAGDVLMQASKEVASKSEFIAKPIGLLGEGYDIDLSNPTNKFVNVVTMGQIMENACPPVGSAIKNALPHINFI